MRIKLILALGLTLSSATIGLANQNLTLYLDVQEPLASQEQVVKTPMVKPQLPTISLQKALKLAEKYIRKQRIDISPYYLIEAEFIIHGEMKGKQFWHFHYASKIGEYGSFVDIYVSMDGKASRSPLM